MPSTESKIKNGLFGFSVAKNPKETVWQQHIDKVDKGVLKDIYPINFINDAVLNSESFQREVMTKSVGTISDSDNQLYKWTLNPEEIQKARNNLSDSILLINAVTT